MAVVSKATLKSYFNTGDKPTESQFADLIDTLYGDNALKILTTRVVNGVLYSTDNNGNELIGKHAYFAIQCAFGSIANAVATSPIFAIRHDSYFEAYFSALATHCVHLQMNYDKTIMVELLSFYDDAQEYLKSGTIMYSIC